VIGFGLLAGLVLASRSLQRRLLATAGITVLAGLAGVVVYWLLVAAVIGRSLSS
jgi:hypothetical protein